MSTPITIETIINANIEEAWSCWSEPEHIEGWAFASDDWEAKDIENDLRAGGAFKTRMQAKDGSFGFDFTGTYTDVRENEHIAYTMDDGRQVSIGFKEVAEGVQIIETFDPEKENPPEAQRKGWQAILDNFKKYVEGRV